MIELPEFGFNAEALISQFMGLLMLGVPTIIAAGGAWQVAKIGVQWIRRYIG